MSMAAFGWSLDKRFLVVTAPNDCSAEARTFLPDMAVVVSSGKTPPLSPSEARTESKPPTQLSSRTKKPGDLATYEEIGKYSEFPHLRTLHEKLAKTKNLV
jgi:hypothetical protein